MPRGREDDSVMTWKGTSLIPNSKSLWLRASNKKDVMAADLHVTAQTVVALGKISCLSGWRQTGESSPQTLG